MVIGSDGSALVYLLWLMVSPTLTAVNGSSTGLYTIAVTYELSSC